MQQGQKNMAQVILMILCLVSIFSVGATYDSYNATSNLLVSEYDKQVTEVANSLDYSLSSMLNNDDRDYYAPDDRIAWQQFYYDAVDSKHLDKYLIVFYDEDTGVLLQNDDTSPIYSVVAPEDLEKQSAQYKTLIEHIREGKTYTDSFSRKNPNGARSNYRGVVIPSVKSQNGQISIMVSGDSSYIFNSLKKIMLMLMLSVAATVAGVVILVIAIYMRSRKQSLLENQLEGLKKETEYTKQLLDQQAEIEHHQRLEYLGTLTAGIAHEFNNMLTPIIGYSLLLLNETAPEDNEHYDELLEIYNSADKARNLVKRLSLISGKGESGAIGIINPNELILSVLNLVEPVRFENVQVVTELNSDMRICFNETQFSQIFINLITNAFHALEPDGGIVRISTENRDDSIEIKVSDNGCGIDDRIKDKIFEPFYTTKGPYKGTGLGLAIVQQILQNNMSNIALDSKLGEGSCFTITIPCVDYEDVEESELE